MMQALIVVALVILLPAQAAPSRLEVIAARAKAANRTQVDVEDPVVMPVTFSNPDNEFRDLGAVVVSHNEMDIATNVTGDWVYSWTKATVERVVSRGQSKLFELACAAIPRPTEARPKPGEVAIPLRRGSTTIDGVKLRMSGWESKLEFRRGGQYLLFGGFCGQDEFLLTGPDPLVYSVNLDGRLGAALGVSRPILEEKKTITGIANYLASLSGK